MPLVKRAAKGKRPNKAVSVLGKAAPWPALATEASGLARLTQSSQSTDLRTYQPLSSRVGMYSVVQSSPVAPTALFDCAT